MNTVFSFIAITMILGFPRVYNSEIPLAIFVLPFFLKELIDFVRQHRKLVAGFFLISALWFFWGLISFFAGNGDGSDLFFHFQMLIKIMMNAIFGIILYHLIHKNYAPLFWWLGFQFVLIAISAFYKSVYMALLSFISPKSAEIFQEIFRIRTVGFGLFHVDGAIILISTCCLWLMLAHKKIVKYLTWTATLPVAMTLARSSIIPYLLFSIFAADKKIRKILIFSFSAMFIMAMLATSGPLYEAAEIFRNLIFDNQLGSNSVRGTADMYVFPDQYSTWLIGDGRYFGSIADGLTFYKMTDVGYLRFLYFSGINYVFLYILMNLYFLFPIILKKNNLSSGSKQFALALSLIFLILNTKGIQTSSLFASLIFCIFAAESKNNELHSN